MGWGVKYTCHITWYSLRMSLFKQQLTMRMSIMSDSLILLSGPFWFKLCTTYNKVIYCTLYHCLHIKPSTVTRPWYCIALWFAHSVLWTINEKVPLEPDTFASGSVGALWQISLMNFLHQRVMTIKVW